MRDGRERTPMQNWEDACLLLTEEEGKYASIANKELKTAQNKRLKIDGLKLKIAELALQKDEEILSEGCKTYLTKIYGWEKYKKWSLPTGEGHKVTGKGIFVEDLSIQLINTLDGTNYKKNEQVFSNDFITGVPDIIEDGYIVDAKSSWDLVTFLAILAKPLFNVYWWQMQGYFYLTGAAKGEVSYCLISTPEEIIKEEAARLVATGKYESEEEIIRNYSYEDIPQQDRRIKFLIERDDEAIGKIEKRVLKCREYLSIIEDMHTKPVLATGDL